MNKPQLIQIGEKAYRAMFNQQPELCKLQETFYGWVIFLASPKGKAVVKFSREIGRIAKEAEGLIKLRHSVSCPVPEVYFLGREQGYDYLLLEWLDGVASYDLPNDPKAVDIFAEHFTDILIELHEYSNRQGFESEPDQFTPDILTAFDCWMEPVLRYVSSSCSPFSSELKEAYQQLWEQRAAVLAPLNTQSSLVHDDSHIANTLFDPNTFKVAALLDPCDIGFKHREFDVFHLDDVRPDLNLIERYQAKYPLAEGFDSRRWFLSLWDDAKHSRNMGWYDEAWLNNKLNLYQNSLK